MTDIATLADEVQSGRISRTRIGKLHGRETADAVRAELRRRDDEQRARMASLPPAPPCCDWCGEEGNLADVGGLSLCDACIETGRENGRIYGEPAALWPTCLLDSCGCECECGHAGLPHESGLCEKHREAAERDALFASIEAAISDAGLEIVGASGRSEATYWARPEWPQSDRCRVRIARHDSVYQSSLDCVSIVLSRSAPLESHAWILDAETARIMRDGKLVDVTIPDAIAHAVAIAEARAR